MHFHPMTNRESSWHRIAALVVALITQGPASHASASEPQAMHMQTAAVTDADVKSQFESHPHDYDEYRLSHIFIAIEGDDTTSSRKTRRSEAQALARAWALKRRLDAGADFALLAKTQSDDGATASIGGELSSIFDMYLADEFVAAVHRLAVGQVSPPTRGPNGYHLVRLEELHPATFETAKGMIEARLQEEARARSNAEPSRDGSFAVDRGASGTAPTASLQP